MIGFFHTSISKDKKLNTFEIGNVYCGFGVFFIDAVELERETEVETHVLILEWRHAANEWDFFRVEEELTGADDVLFEECKVVVVKEFTQFWQVSVILSIIRI